MPRQKECSLDVRFSHTYDVRQRLVMTSNAAIMYRSQPANERQEFRLSALLKEHLQRAAVQTGKSVAEYITDAVAERVSNDLSVATEWVLSTDEQTALLKILVSAPPVPTARALAAAEKADAFFGTIAHQHSR